MCLNGMHNKFAWFPCANDLERTKRHLRWRLLMTPARLPNSLAAVCASVELLDGSRSAILGDRLEALCLA